MKKEIIKSLTNEFESYVSFTNQGIEFWFARDLQHLLGYSEWRNFTKVINKAKTACETAGHTISDHFVDINKMVTIGSETQREIKEIMLTRFACYLIAQNGDPQKEQIAFAQNYFAVQTRKFEIIEQRINDWERLKTREKLTLSEKELSAVIYERGIDDLGFAIIRSKGDKALFGGFSTQEMKTKLSVPKNRPLADFLPTITIKAKDFEGNPVYSVVEDKVLQVVVSESGSQQYGVSMKTNTQDDFRLPIDQMDWYIYDDNFGTSEEKYFVKYINNMIDDLKEKYENIYLLRNEGLFKVFRFSDGQALEPDFVLFMRAKETNKKLNYQIFVEPKGGHLIAEDKWKEEFLEEVKENSNINPSTLYDCELFKLVGLPFYNQSDEQFLKFEESFRKEIGIQKND